MATRRSSIAIIDYGVGNLRSLANAVEEIGHEPELVDDPEHLRKADRIVLPGVGAIEPAMRTLRAKHFVEPILECAARGTPILGVCLGMQLLCTRSFENGTHEALDLIPAEVRPFDPAHGLKIPHIGWNSIRWESAHPLLDGVTPSSDVYFVHSYHASCANDGNVLAWTDYGEKFASMLVKENILGAQFHPEKSQFVGLKMLQNFAGL